MSTDSQFSKANVASDGPQEAPALQSQPDPQNSSGQKVDIKALAKKISEEIENMTREEKLERFPWMKKDPSPGVPASTAMRILEEMEEKERKEAEAEDEDETTGAVKAF